MTVTLVATRQLSVALKQDMLREILEAAILRANPPE
jgi:hypothetical protein